jgi:uncharacterized protein (DUF1778 family)
VQSKTEGGSAMAEKKSERVSLVMGPEEKALLTELAERDGRSICSFMRWLIRQHAAELETAELQGANA